MNSVDRKWHDQTLALAGVFQAATLVEELANHGIAPSQPRDASLKSILLVDADSVDEIYQVGSGFELGLTTLAAQLDGPERNATIIRYVILLLQLERTMSRSKGVLKRLGDGLQQLTEYGPLDSIDQDLIGRLSDLYAANVSPLSPRIMVHGDVRHLQQRLVTNQIRALLLAGLRSAVLWQQLKGSRWALVMKRRRYASEARSLATRATQSLH